MGVDEEKEIPKGLEKLETPIKGIISTIPFLSGPLTSLYGDYVQSVGAISRSR